MGAPINMRWPAPLFICLAGAAPFDDSNPAVVISRHVNAPPPSIGARRPELAGLDAVFATAMAKQPSQRLPAARSSPRT